MDSLFAARRRQTSAGRGRALGAGLAFAARQLASRGCASGGAALRRLRRRSSRLEEREIERQAAPFVALPSGAVAPHTDINLMAQSLWIGGRALARGPSALPQLALVCAHSNEKAPILLARRACSPSVSCFSLTSLRLGGASTGRGLVQPATRSPWTHATQRPPASSPSSCSNRLHLYFLPPSSARWSCRLQLAAAECLWLGRGAP